jgi:hypothetical protein
MKNETVLKKIAGSVEIELYCECEGMSFKTIWSPGFIWKIEIVEKNNYKDGNIDNLLNIFNSVKTKFDITIVRLEREYKRFGEIVSELPTAEEKEKLT